MEAEEPIAPSRDRHLPRGWTNVALADLGAWYGGGTPSKQNSAFWTDGTIPWVSPKDMKSFEIHDAEDHITDDAISASATSKLAADTVLMVTRSGILRHTFPVGVARVAVAINQDLKAVTPYKGMLPAYIAYALRAFGQTILQSCTKGGTTVQSIESPALKRFRIPLAPTCEQARIAEALDELFSDLDAGIAALERTQQKLKLYRASVLKAVVEGTLTAEWRAQHPDTEPATELLKRILAERRRRWEEDQLAKFKAKGQEPPRHWKARYNDLGSPKIPNLPALPNTWCWSSLGECFQVQVGATPSRANNAYWGGNIPWVASGEVQFCRIYDTREKISDEGLLNSSTRLNPAGSIILNMIGEGKTRGKAGILEIAACNNQNCAAIWVSETPVEPRFVYFWLLYRYEQNRELGSGNNQPAMNKRIVEGIAFPLPPLAEQEAIVEAVEDQMSVIDHLEADIDAKLTISHSLRQAILRHAFTGQLVPQDSNDEPAFELLKRIAAERDARSKQVPKPERRQSKKAEAR